MNRPHRGPGEVNVSDDQIEKLMAERRAAERAEVEKNEPPEPGQPPPRPRRKIPAWTENCKISSFSGFSPMWRRI